MGSFRLVAGNRHLHRYYNFAGRAVETVPKSLREIAISIGILVASTFGIGILSAKIYRVGVLMYGTSPKIGNIIKAVWKA